MQVKKQQLELDMEQWTGSKVGKGYIKAIYFHPAYLTSMQSACMHAKLLQLCLTLCNTMDMQSAGSSVHGNIQARIPEWVAMPFSRG